MCEKGLKNIKNTGDERSHKNMGLTLLRRQHASYIMQHIHRISLAHCSDACCMLLCLWMATWAGVGQFVLRIFHMKLSFYSKINLPKLPTKFPLVLVLFFTGQCVIRCWIQTIPVSVKSLIYITRENAESFSEMTLISKNIWDITPYQGGWWSVISLLFASSDRKPGGYLEGCKRQ